MALTTETRLATDELTKRFLVPFSLEGEAKAIRDCLPLLPLLFRGIAETFIDRLSATIQTTSEDQLIVSPAEFEELLLHALSIGSEFLAGLASLLMSNPSINSNAAQYIDLKP